MCQYSYDYFYHAYFILSYQSEKRVTERNNRLKLKVYLLINWGTQPVFDSRCWIIENNLCQIPTHSFWIFCQTESLFFLCSLMSCPNFVRLFNPPKMSEISKKSQIWLAQTRKWFSILYCSKQQIDSNLKIYISIYL